MKNILLLNVLHLNYNNSKQQIKIYTIKFTFLKIRLGLCSNRVYFRSKVGHFIEISLENNNDTNN